MITSVSKEDGRTASLITRDFLGVGCGGGGGGGFRPANSGELDQGRKVYLDLNLMPNSDLKLGLGLGMGMERMEPLPRRLGYESVCTLDKVRLALERAEREARCRGGGNKRREEGGGGGASTSSSTTTTTSVRRRRRREGEEGESYEAESTTTTTTDSSPAAAAAAAMMLAGCPRCLLYVLICKGNPRCPRCGSHVPVADLEGKKRARIDLNSSD